MHRTASLVVSRNSRSFVDVDDAAFGVARRSEADRRSFMGNLAEAKDIGQDRGRFRALSSSRVTPWKPRIACSGRDVAVAPARRSRIGDTDERERQPVDL